MSSLTIDQKWWTDPRRSTLIRLLGSEDKADLLAIRAWRLAQDSWSPQSTYIPVEIFILNTDNEKLIDAKLAEYRPAGVYIRGSGERFSHGGTAARKSRVRRLPVNYQSVKELQEGLGKEKLNEWMQIYDGDQEFLEREMLKAFAFYRDNPRKAPKFVSTWKTKLSWWFENSWNRRAKSGKFQVV